MEQVENKLVAEARYQFIMEQAAELMEIDNQDEEAQRDYLNDRILSTKLVSQLLDISGFDSFHELADFMDEADPDELELLLRDLEGVTD